MGYRTTADKLKAVGLREGFRSGLEEKIAAQLDALNVPYSYETIKIKYFKPVTYHTYTPDFGLPNGIIIETKGRFTSEDRKKHLAVKDQHPELDIRFVFSNSKARLNKKSKTTYADWCQTHGFLFADKRIPEEWINEFPIHNS